MRRIAAVALILCSCQTSPTRAPLHAAPSALPKTLESCSQLGQEQGGRRCSIYDTRKQTFSEQPDGTPEDALARRAFLYERWLDLYNAPEKQPIVRRLVRPMQPGTPESEFGDPKNFAGWDDQGDSAGFSDDALDSALFHYAVTGTEADYQRFESWARGLVRQWDATGMDGYLARFHYAGVPSGTPRLDSSLSLDIREPNDNGPLDIPERALDRMPAYYRAGIDAGGKHVAVKPSWIGGTSIDAYSGSMNSWPLAFQLVRDAALKERMARHYGCFLKRLRILKVINLSKNTQLQADLAHYLTSSILKLDPGDPDLTKIDEVWGFYLPQFNHASAAAYPTECPAHLATDADPADVIDVSRPGFDGKLLDLIFRQANGDQATSIDFAYYPSVRAGDAVMLEAYALGAYHLTGDSEFLRWRDQILIGKANSREISRTVGAFTPPRPCRGYYRTPNVYLAHFMRTLIDGDAGSRDFAAMLWRKKFAPKEVFGLRDSLFEILYAGALSEKGAGYADAIPDLLAFGGMPGHLDDPRRNYAVDLAPSPPPGIAVGVATAEELKICSQPITIMGITIPGGAPDPNVKYVSPAPPVVQRPPDNWIWEKDPFAAARLPWDAGMQQYAGLDLIEPYWIARYYGLLPDAHLVLAWK